MRINVNELSGIALNWAVAKCEGISPITAYNQFAIPVITAPAGYSPSSDWSQGGPIIEREKIALLARDTHWIARVPIKAVSIIGPTPLVAAMRCLVASKLGDTVEVPDELCQ